MKSQDSVYDKFPVVSVKGFEKSLYRGWTAICGAITEKISQLGPGRKIVAIDCYQGTNDPEIMHEMQVALNATFLSTRDFMLDEGAIDALVYPDVTDDEVFGFITRLEIMDFFDPKKLTKLSKIVSDTNEEVIYLYGLGAARLLQPDLIIYMDMPRWEIQMRFRRNEISNIGVSNASLKASLQYKRAFFVDWKVCDKHKKSLLQVLDFVIDTTRQDDPKMITAASFHGALEKAIAQPLRLVPFFDPGPWGGQWMKSHFQLDPKVVNYAWCFDCVPEENSLLFDFGTDFIYETPSINLVFAKSRQLLGDAVQARFGDEFPIRFDFLDTMGGGNLSLQVHPTTEYIRTNFGMNYTQDESYYIMDAADDAVVYLGLKDHIDGDEMIAELHAAQNKGTDFQADDFVQQWQVNKHDHILIPAGTVHCSGKNSMVLEISATPFIFTFKLWDWGRMGMDGKPRPLNIERGAKVIDWGRTPQVVQKEHINNITLLSEGDGWKEERTGLHEREFIETRRHWFNKTVLHENNGSVHVLNLVEGAQAIVESPDQAFAPFVIHYAETFIIPAAVRHYTIRPYGPSTGKTCATLKAFVRINP